MRLFSSRYFAFGLVPKNDHAPVWSLMCLFVQTPRLFARVESSFAPGVSVTLLNSSRAVLSVEGYLVINATWLQFPPTATAAGSPPHPCSCPCPCEPINIKIVTISCSLSGGGVVRVVLFLARVFSGDSEGGDRGAAATGGRWPCLVQREVAVGCRAWSVGHRCSPPSTRA